MDIFIPPLDRELIQRAVDHAIAGDEELGRHCAKLALVIDSRDEHAGSVIRTIAARLDVLRARLQATQELLTEVLLRADRAAVKQARVSS